MAEAIQNSVSPAIVLDFDGIWNMLSQGVIVAPSPGKCGQGWASLTAWKSIWLSTVERVRTFQKKVT